MHATLGCINIWPGLQSSPMGGGFTGAVLLDDLVGRHIGGLELQQCRDHAECMAMLLESIAVLPVGVAEPAVRFTTASSAYHRER